MKSFIATNSDPIIPPGGAKPDNSLNKVLFLSAKGTSLVASVYTFIYSNGKYSSCFDYLVSWYGSACDRYNDSTATTTKFEGVTGVLNKELISGIFSMIYFIVPPCFESPLILSKSSLVALLLIYDKLLNFNY